MQVRDAMTSVVRTVVGVDDGERAVGEIARTVGGLVAVRFFPGVPDAPAPVGGPR